MRQIGVLGTLIVPLWIFGPLFVEGRKGLGDFEQEWGHVTVRPHAHMFWWLFYTTADVHHFVDRPLLIWLQGGPGMPSSGYGNFLEIGPLALDLSQRDTTWVKLCNVLFVDNPVGAGFSYFSNETARIVENNEEIGRDLIAFLRNFLERFPDFQTVPIFVFGESYGGKMAVEFVKQAVEETRIGNLVANIRGVGLGDAYISPIDYILNYPSFALNLGIIDKSGFDELQIYSNEVRIAIENNNFSLASEIETKILDSLLPEGMDIYNIGLKSNMTSSPTFMTYQDECNYLMNHVVKEALNLTIYLEWKYFNRQVYDSLINDLMKPVTDTVEILLNQTDVKVIVYNGVFDFIVNTAGTSMWLNDLRWENTKEWYETPKKALQIGAVNEAYVKNVGNLTFYSVLRAGHSVPIDNPVLMEELIRTEVLNT